MENYGNFFGQNLFVGAAGVLLMVGTFQSLDIKVNAIDLVLASLPIAVIVFFIVWINNIRFDKYLDRKYGKKQVERHE
ncbi:putative membrane protein [Staphylococcus cohnii]